VYVVPPVAFLAGATLLFLAFRTWRRTEKEPIMGAGNSSSPGSVPENAKEPDSAADDEYIARFEEELKKRN
jgi:hypothetical protein